MHEVEALLAEDDEATAAARYAEAVAPDADDTTAAGEWLRTRRGEGNAKP